MTSAKVDAVVVGSGPNGLSAAIALAQSGRSVLVLEAQDRLGGAVATEELTLPGFHHDVFSSVYPAGAASPVFAKLPLERHGLRWVQPEIPMAHPLDDGRAIALMRDVDATAATLDAVHPATAPRGVSSRRRTWSTTRRCARRCCPGSHRSPGRRGCSPRSSSAAPSTSSRSCSAPRGPSAGGSSRIRAPAAGSTARRCTATSHPATRAARSPRSTSRCSATRSAGPARRAAQGG